jgi:hypothetical protein
MQTNRFCVNQTTPKEHLTMAERITITESFPTSAVVRVSRASFDPSRAAQLDRLKEMVVDGRRDMEAVGVTFTRIFNYPIDWTWIV